ncbi:YlcI/YnfO family protein [Phytobacter palmae]|uniref:YlcI/YnfO family protein n=1 Tax=Phytobacter palmae TaxID=1855371 RepID=A0ABU9VBX0_9ENTR
MSTGMKNAKSQTISTRVPHEIVEAIESVKRDGENTAAFVITAFRNEIARRQTATTGPENVQLELNKALETLALIGDIGEQAVSNARAISALAKEELQRHQRK